MIPVFVNKWVIQYSLKLPPLIFNHSDELLKIKITTTYATIFDHNCKLKSKIEWSDGWVDQWRYYYNASTDISLTIVTDAFNNKVNCMSIDHYCMPSIEYKINLYGPEKYYVKIEVLKI